MDLTDKAIRNLIFALQAFAIGSMCRGVSEILHVVLELLR